MFELFTWRGKPIPDIHEWARMRGEKLVRYRATRETFSYSVVTESPDGDVVITPRIEPFLYEEVREGTMPESFWGNLRMDNGWVYKEVERFDPNSQGSP